MVKDTRKLIPLYPNGYKRTHSAFLKEHFDINPNGVDWHNPYNLGIEFKETFAKDKNSLWFKVPKKQIANTDLFVFCVYNTKFFVVDANEIEELYSFETYGNRANIRLGKVETLAMREFHNILNLKKYLNNLESLE